MASPQADFYAVTPGERLKVGRRFIEIVTSSGLWIATIPSVTFAAGTPAVFSFAPYITTDANVRTTRLSLASGYSLPEGVTLDADGHRFIYDGSGSGGTVSTQLIADDDPTSSGYGIAAWRIGDSGRGATWRDFAYYWKPWEVYGGTWSDSTWTAQGTTPFATVSVAQNISTDTLVTLDVSSLVLEWDVTPNRLTAMFLMTANGYGLSLRSMEYADATKRPVLRVTYSDGSTSDINPTVDVSIDGSSPDMRDGKNVTLNVSGSARTILQFHRPDVVKKRVASAQLRMYCFSSQNYAGIGIKVYQVVAPDTGTLPAVRQGISAEFANDLAMAGDPRVVDVMNLNDPAWAAVATPNSNIGRYYVQGAGVLLSGQSTPSGRAIEATIPAHVNGGKLMFCFLPESDEMYFRYYIQFHGIRGSTFDGGKMPGFSAYGSFNHYHNNPFNPYFNYVSPRTGSYGAGYASDGTGNPAGTEGWSARGGWYAPGVEGESPHRRVAINAYIYDATVNAEGVSYHWNTYTDDLQWLEEDRWYCIEQRIKLNTLSVDGTVANSDGIFQSWVDGRLACDKQNVKWRAAYKYPDEPHYDGPGLLQIHNIWFDWYLGGVGDLSTAPVTLRLADVVVARDYIGPRT